MRSMLRFLGFLLRTSREIRLSRLSLIGVVVAGAASGFGGTGLLVAINHALTSPDLAPELLLGSFLVLCLVVSVCAFISQDLVGRVGAAAIFELRLKLGRKILEAPFERLEKVGPHRLLVHLADDIGVISTALVDMPLLAMHAAIISGCLAYMAWLSEWIFLVVLGALLVGSVAYRVPIGWANRRFAAMREDLDSMYHHYRGLIHGIKELKLHRARRGEFLDGVYRANAESIRELAVDGNIIMAGANSGGRLLFFFVIGVLVFGLPRFRAVDMGLMVSFVTTLLFIRSPIEIFLGRLPGLARAAVAARKLEQLEQELGETRHELEAASGSPDIPATPRNLELRAITYSYRRDGEDHDFVVGPIDLELAPGEVVFLIGGNGSGKTTLAKLLVGLYQAEEGQIFYGGEEVTEERRDLYRQNFAAIFADFYLFDDLLGLEEEGLEDAASAYLEELQLDHKVRIEGRRFSTLDLSQGQRKRLALLTAYLEDRPIYLFDEWASDQDPVFREIFYREILADLKQRGKTVVVISHDDRYYDLADRLVKLEYGQRVSAPAPVLATGAAATPRLEEGP